MSSVAIKHTKKCYNRFQWWPPKRIFFKDKHYDRKYRKSLETIVAIVKYGHHDVLNKGTGNFAEKSAWKPLPKSSLEVCFKQWLYVANIAIWKQPQSLWLKSHFTIFYLVILLILLYLTWSFFANFLVWYFTDMQLLRQGGWWKNNGITAQKDRRWNTKEPINVSGEIVSTWYNSDCVFIQSIT